MSTPIPESEGGGSVSGVDAPYGGRLMPKSKKIVIVHGRAGVPARFWDYGIMYEHIFNQLKASGKTEAVICPFPVQTKDSKGHTVVWDPENQLLRRKRAVAKG